MLTHPKVAYDPSKLLHNEVLFSSPANTIIYNCGASQCDRYGKVTFYDYTFLIPATGIMNNYNAYTVEYDSILEVYRVFMDKNSDPVDALWDECRNSDFWHVKAVASSFNTGNLPCVIAPPTTKAVSLETDDSSSSSSSGENSGYEPNTPITPFSPAQQSFPEVDYDEVELSPLIQSLDLATLEDTYHQWNGSTVDRLNLEIYDASHELYKEKSISIAQVVHGKKMEACPVTALRTVDLDAVFGGDADDLYEDIEASNQTARSLVASQAGDHCPRSDEGRADDVEEPLAKTMRKDELVPNQAKEVSAVRQVKRVIANVMARSDDRFFNVPKATAIKHGLPGCSPLSQSWGVDEVIGGQEPRDLSKGRLPAKMAPKSTACPIDYTKAPVEGNAECKSYQTAPSKPAYLRQFVPAGSDDEVDDVWLASPLISLVRSFADIDNLAEAVWIWQHMCLKTRAMRATGEFVPRRLIGIDGDIEERSTYIHPTNQMDVGYREHDLREIHLDRVPFTKPVKKCKGKEGPMPHHYNIMGHPVYCRTYTPPEVSLWASQQTWKPHFRTESTEGVLVSQAWKLVDPYSYNGPAELLVLGGSKLREAVIGFVDKVYEPFGTWGYDRYDYDESVPKTTYDVPDFVALANSAQFGMPQQSLSLDPQDSDTVMGDSDDFYQAESDASQNWQQKDALDFASEPQGAQGSDNVDSTTPQVSPSAVQLGYDSSDGPVDAFDRVHGSESEAIEDRSYSDFLDESFDEEDLVQSTPSQQSRSIASLSAPIAHEEYAAPSPSSSEDGMDDGIDDEQSSPTPARRFGLPLEGLAAARALTDSLMNGGSDKEIRRLQAKVNEKSRSEVRPHINNSDDEDSVDNTDTWTNPNRKPVVNNSLLAKYAEAEPSVEKFDNAPGTDQQESEAPAEQAAQAAQAAQAVQTVQAEQGLLPSETELNNFSIEECSKGSSQDLSSSTTAPSDEDNESLDDVLPEAEAILHRFTNRIRTRSAPGKSGDIHTEDSFDDVFPHTLRLVTGLGHTVRAMSRTTKSEDGRAQQSQANPNLVPGQNVVGADHSLSETLGELRRTPLAGDLGLSGDDSNEPPSKLHTIAEGKKPDRSARRTKFSFNEDLEQQDLPNEEYSPFRPLLDHHYGSSSSHDAFPSQALPEEERERMLELDALETAELKKNWANDGAFDGDFSFQGEREPREPGESSESSSRSFSSLPDSEQYHSDASNISLPDISGRAKTKDLKITSSPSHKQESAVDVLLKTLDEDPSDLSDADLEKGILLAERLRTEAEQSKRLHQQQDLKQDRSGEEGSKDTGNPEGSGEGSVDQSVETGMADNVEAVVEHEIEGVMDAGTKKSNAESEKDLLDWLEERVDLEIGLDDELVEPQDLELGGITDGATESNKVQNERDLLDWLEERADLETGMQGDSKAPVEQEVSRAVDGATGVSEALSEKTLLDWLEERIATEAEELGDIRRGRQLRAATTAALAGYCDVSEIPATQQTFSEYFFGPLALSVGAVVARLPFVIPC